MELRQRLSPDERRDSILNAAMRLASRRDYQHITREKIAAEANVSPALVTHYLGPILDIHDVIMTKAVEQGIVSIVAHGLIHKHVIAMGASEELRTLAWAYISEGKL